MSKLEDAKNEGEGNKSADQRYRTAAKKYAATGAPEEAGEEARRALEGPEREELQEAEADAKAGHTMPKKTH